MAGREAEALGAGVVGDGREVVPREAAAATLVAKPAEGAKAAVHPAAATQAAMAIRGATLVGWVAQSEMA